MTPDSGGEDATFSAAARSVWGKSDVHDETSWLPVVQHLIDSAQIAELLWDDWLPPAVKSRIEAALPPDARDGRTLFAWLAGSHDVGKSSPAFASAALHLVGRMREHGMDVGPSVLGERSKAPHASVGAIAVIDWMKDRYGASLMAANTYADIVGAHHGIPATARYLGEVRKRRELVGMGTWADVRVEALDTMARLTGADRHLHIWAQHPLPTEAAFLLTGAVIVADWLASNERNFPYQDTIDASDERARLAWDHLGFPPPWRPGKPRGISELFARRFPDLAQFEPRPIQRACFDAAAASDSPKLLILEAPMGGGKTEAALLAAEALATYGAGGIYFGLPTMATSNAMFYRLVDWIDTLKGPQSTFLAHSKRTQNDLFDEMLNDARTQTWNEAGAIAVPWMTGRKTGITANFVVGTVDQALMAALYSRHVMLRHLALAGKVVVIDEVHAADDYMRMYLERALEWLAAYGVSVVLLSATLPSAQRAELVQAYRRGLGVNDTDAAPADEYPVLTTADLTSVTTTSIESDSTTRQTSLEQVGDEADDVLHALKQLTAGGGCIGVIRNTVARAQETARTLREHFGASVVLLHSRFLAFERAEREAELVRRLGRGGDRPDLLIVVGTQVLEQSLDIDFDLLITDIAPTDSLLQRMGRLHRHDRDHRPTALAEPRVLLTGIKEWSETGPAFDRGAATVYHEARLLRAAATWGLTSSSSARTVTLPGDIRPDIETAYGARPPHTPEAWAERLSGADAALATKLEDARNKADTFRFKQVPKEPTRLGRFWEAATSSEERVAGSTVRDGEDGIEVLVVRRVDDALQTMSGLGDFGERDLPGFLGVPEPSLARTIARSSLPLPKAMTIGQNGDAVIDALEDNGLAAWQQSPWLSGHLILVLDEDNSATVAGFRVRYDSFLGFILDRIKEDR